MGWQPSGIKESRLILADSSVWIDYFNNVINWQTDKLDAIIGIEPVIITDHILLEVLRGFRNEKDYSSAKYYLDRFPCYNTIDKELAIKCVENYRFLRKMGITVKSTVDLIIATYCIENNLILLHNDHDYDPLEELLGLKVIHPALE
jgi:predicted nucleic acid-binding protein